MKINIKLFFVFLFLISLDQIAKYFSTSPYCNKNLAWNIPVSGEIFYILWILIMSYFLYLLIKTKKYSEKIFLTVIFSGAVSNTIDRLRFGCVIDYVNLKIFPVFNLADIYITIGIFLLLIGIIKNKSREATP